MRINTIFIIYILLFFYSIFNSIWGTQIRLYFRRRRRRREVLEKAKSFLKPYKNIFGELNLSNQFCTVCNMTGKSIFCIEKNNTGNKTKLSFYAERGKSSIYTIDEIWDTLCERFNYQTSFEDSFEICSKLGLKVKTNYISNKPAQTTKEEDKILSGFNKLNTKFENETRLIDINSCSEADFIALPGITVMMAKKIIKYRNENGAFNSIDEFINYIKIKPHFEKQIKTLITISKIKNKAGKKLKLGRILDI